MSKSKLAALWLILGVAALTIWLAWPTGNAPSHGQQGLPTATASSPPSFPAAPSPGGRQASVPAAVVSPAAPGVAQPAGTAPDASHPIASTTVPALTPGEPGAPNQAAQIDAGRVRHMISDYHTLMGENPVGTNAEIMKQMTGGNARQATLGPPEGVSLNAQGELVDQWGSPYFFHQLSRDKMEVRSAGPDKVMWTADDVIAR